MRSKTTGLHPLLILLAVAMASILFVVSCGGGGEATEVAQVPEVVEEAEVAQVTEAVEEAEVAQVPEVVEEAEAAGISAAELAEEAGAAAAEAEAGGPKYGGTLRVAILADHLTLDPPRLFTDPDIVITKATYDNLLQIQPDLSVKPELAESWEANDDLSSYTFHLRQGVKFHNGKDFKAEDVAFTFNRIMDPILDSAVRPTFASTIQDIVIIDDYTVRFDLLGPNGFFIPAFSLFHARIVRADVDIDRLTLETFGTGPFKIVEHLPGERTTMVRNDDYWEEGKPYLDEFVVQLIPEPAARAEALKSGDIDVIYDLEAQSVAGIEAHSDTVVLENIGFSWIGLPMRTDTPPFDDIRVRQAFQLATDRESIRQAAFLGRGSVASDHPIHPSHPLFAPQHIPPDYNPEAAKALLAEAGYPDGIDVTLHTAPVFAGADELAVAFKESAAPAGIRVNVARHSSDGFWDTYWNIEPFTVVYWNGRPTPDQALGVQYLSDAAWNAPRYVNLEFDELVFRARGEKSEDQKATYAEIQRILIEDVPRIAVAFRPSLYGARANVRGILPPSAGDKRPNLRGRLAGRLDSPSRQRISFRSTTQGRKGMRHRLIH